jgi:alpha-tubulin suppressor-like RCC1 family protein
MKKILVLTLILTMLMGVIAFAQGESGSILSSGYGNTYIIKNDGTLWGCGSQYVGNGTGYKEEQIEFVKILDNVRSVSSGGSQARVAVKKDDTLWVWGSMEGYPDGGTSLDPTLLYPTKLDIEDVKSASVSDRYILALKNDNTLWICGDMYTGDGTNEKALSKDGFEKIAGNVIDMFADNDTVFYIKDDNTLWGYGDNNHSQLGNMESVKEDVLTPVKILDDVKQICTNYGVSVIGAIRLDNSLYLWGDGGFYTEEYGWIEDAGSPYKAMDNVKTSVVDSEEAFIVKTDNTLWTWGYSYEGKSVSNEQLPYKVADNVLDVTIGERHAAIIKTDNTLWTMGGDYRGGLGYKANETWYTVLTKVFDNVQDAPATWAYEEVEKAIGAQLIPEDMQNNYTKPITREEFCILAIRMIEVRSGMGIDEYLAEVGVEIAPIGTFRDCDTKEVRAAKVLGITDGVGGGEFAPSDLLNREQAAKFLTTTALACGRDVKLGSPNYSDLDEIANWAKPYTGYVYDIGVMKGVGSNKFNPKGSYQRQQAFMTMYRIWKAIDEAYPGNVEVSADTSTSEDGPLGIEYIEDYLSFKPYEEDYMSVYTGTYTTNDVVEQLQKNIYYRVIDGNIQIREDDYSDRGLGGFGVVSHIAIYNATADTTFMRMYRASDYAQTIDGNHLEFKYLDPNYFEELQVSENVKDFLATFHDESGVIEITQFLQDGTTIKINYSAINMMPISYKKTSGSGSDKTVLEYELSETKENYDILDFIMDTDSIE